MGACAEHRSYSHGREFLHNLPYLFMLLLGSAVLWTGWRETPFGWIAAAGYFAYGLLGVLWVIVFICPYCHFYGTRTCPCGYGQFAAKLRAGRDGSRFAEMFRWRMPAIYPLWFIPPVAGGILLARDFSILLLVLLLAFAVDAFVVLPFVSRKYCCASCPQKEGCPWMRSG